MRHPFGNGIQALVIEREPLGRSRFRAATLNEYGGLAVFSVNSETSVRLPSGLLGASHDRQ
jgi:hypothetical protein